MAEENKQQDFALVPVSLEAFSADNDLINSDNEALQIMNTRVVSNDLNFDEFKFKALLAESNALNFQEKMQIIQAVPSLTQYQINSVIKILLDEVTSYRQIVEDHKAAILEIEKQKIDAEAELEREIEERLETREDKAKIDALKKSLGIS